MGDNRSLDEFAAASVADDDESENASDGANENRDDDAGENGDGDVEETGSTDAEPTVEPATPTARWRPDGTACDRCGETVERAWRDEDVFVCADCKDW